MTQVVNGKSDTEPVAHVDAAIEHLIPSFLERQAKNVELILRALTLGDLETVENLGHNMKGAGGGYGFDAITTIGLCIEQAVSDKNYQEIRKLVGDLLTYLERVEVVYE